MALGFHVPRGESATIDKLESSKRWYMVAGVIEVVVGMIALVSALFDISIAAPVLAVILLVISINEIVFSFTSGSPSRFFLHLFEGVLTAGMGLMMFRYEVFEQPSLLVVWALYFAVVGLMTIVADVIERGEAWGWFLLSGAVTFVLGVVLWFVSESAPPWIISTCVGVHCMVGGFALLSVMRNVMIREKQSAAHG